MPKIEQYQCDAVGCTAMRREVNNWLVVLYEENGVHIYHWDKAPKKAMESGYRFCGLDHALRYASNALTPNTTDPARESTLELRPPLGRDGEAQ